MDELQVTESKQKPLSAKGRIIFGLVFASAGIMPVLAAFDIGALSSADINGPHWLGLVAGGVFIVAGMSIMVGAGRPVLSGFLSLLVLLGLAAIGNWVAFGVGARVCTGTAMFWSNTDMSGLACRVPFGIGAIITNTVVLLMLIVYLQKIMRKPEKLAGLRKLSENLLFFSLAPVLLPLVLFLFGRVGFDVIKTRLATGQWPRNETYLKRMQEKKQKQK
jgi:hypothetical protein